MADGRADYPPADETPEATPYVQAERTIHKCPYCGTQELTDDPMWWRFHLIGNRDCRRLAREAEDRWERKLGMTAATRALSMTDAELITVDALWASLDEEEDA